MAELDKESLRLTKELEFCSRSIASFKTKNDDIKTINRKSDVIVFVTHSPDQLKGALDKSLTDKGISLDYIFIDIKEPYTVSKKTQVFITTDDPLEVNRFKLKNPKSIIVDFTDEISSQYILFYVELMVKNIEKYIKFNIKINKEENYYE